MPTELARPSWTNSTIVCQVETKSPSYSVGNGQWQDLDDTRTTLDGIVAAAVQTVPGARHAGIMEIRQRRRVVTSAATSELVERVDRTQYDVGEGPCLT